MLSPAEGAAKSGCTSTQKRLVESEVGEDAPGDSLLVYDSTRDPLPGRSRFKLSA